MKRLGSWWQQLLLVVSLCFGRASKEERSPEVKQAQPSQKNKCPQKARVGGRRRWRHIRTGAKSSPYVPEEEELLGQAADWQLQQSWRTLQAKALTMSGGAGQDWQLQHEQWSVSKAWGVMPLLLCLGLLTRRKRVAVKHTGHQWLEEEPPLTQTQSRVEGKSTQQCHSQLREAHMPFMRNMRVRNVKGDGNCYWRALALGTGQHWLRTKQQVLEYAKDRDPLWVRKHQKRGIWIDNRGVLYSAEALKLNICIDAGSRRGMWQIDVRGEDTAYLSLRKQHYRRLVAADEQTDFDPHTHFGDVTGRKICFAGGAPKRERGQRAVGARERSRSRSVDFDLTEDQEEGAFTVKIDSKDPEEVEWRQVRVRVNVRQRVRRLMQLVADYYGRPVNDVGLYYGRSNLVAQPDRYLREGSAYEFTLTGPRADELLAWREERRQEEAQRRAEIRRRIEHEEDRRHYEQQLREEEQQQEARKHSLICA